MLRCAAECVDIVVEGLCCGEVKMVYFPRVCGPPPDERPHHSQPLVLSFGRLSVSGSTVTAMRSAGGSWQQSRVSIHLSAETRNALGASTRGYWTAPSSS
ncbi:hypothetical protein BAUCODRAFT_554225 [Baudoinia panamericana UAMH 10762]|uniref:Uncharacterized protein n=1 Tax=Baudoinia panamericana (strain UAMH 10762) TaxID=717646 RepID=M2N6E2_BAUPA|nr:uncharacterized protein BAUCODRAFT_554225 [Baudoinia panamericana UAMH 10762]EMC94614.1 hypothetical protein BAUCODRAFT_554225 [Baudoinia panamericana UAMH 10762]